MPYILNLLFCKELVQCYFDWLIVLALEMVNIYCLEWNAVFTFFFSTIIYNPWGWLWFFLILIMLLCILYELKYRFFSFNLEKKIHNGIVQIYILLHLLQNCYNKVLSGLIIIFY